MKLRLGDKQYIGILVVISVITHVLWFKPGTTLFHVDWVHWSNAAAQQAFQSLGTWSSYFGLGAPRAQISFSFVENVWSFFSIFGLGFDAAVKLSILIPIAFLGFVAPYIAMRQFTTNKFAAFVSAMFYGSSTYLLLRERSHLQIAFVDVFAPIIFVLFVRALNTMKTHMWLLFALAYSLGLCFELRIMYIVTFILGLYAIIFFPKKEDVRRLLKQLIITGLAIGVLSSFWVLPTVMGGLGSSISEITDRSLFGNWLFDLTHAISLSVSSWTGSSPTENFVLQPVQWYLWAIPFVVFLSLVLITQSKKIDSTEKKQVLFFVILAILGIFLTKQSLNPLPGAYAWLYQNFPGFSLFREASKFYLLTMWGYMGLMTLGLTYVGKKKSKVFYAMSAAVLIVAGLNLIPMVTGSIGGLSVSHTQPDDYAKLNAYIAKHDDYARTLSVPSNAQWGFFDATHPMVSMSTIMQQNWSSLYPGLTGSTHNRISTFFNETYTKELIGSSSIRLVVVPSHDSNQPNDPFNATGNNRQYYIDTLDNIPWLKRLNIGMKDVVAYENENYQPYIKSANNAYVFPAGGNIGELYEFSSSNLSTAASFMIKDNQHSEQATGVQDLFGNITAKNVNKGSVATSVHANTQSTLYVNTNNKSVGYELDNQLVKLVSSQSGNLSVNKNVVLEQDNNDVIGMAQYDKTKKYLVIKDDEVIPTNINNEPQRDLGLASKSVALVSQSSENLVPNPSFEQGAWNSKVQDCDNFDDSPLIGMRINGIQRTDGNNSLELDAGNHSACAVTGPIAVAGGEYLLSFDYMDYKAQSADKVGYQVIFNNSEGNKTEEYIVVPDGDWHTVRKLIKVPASVTSLQIKLIGFPRVQIPNRTKTFYDNVHLSQIQTEIGPITNFAPNFRQLPASAIDNEFVYSDSAITAQNLIPNPSFEQGTWKGSVGDCNAYDNKPDLKMGVTSITSDGEKALQLSARRHVACTGTDAIPVKEGGTYILSFDTQSPNVKTARYSISFDNADTTTISDTTPTGNKWKSFSRIITVPTGAHNLKVTVYANSKEGSSKYTINRYDNFKLVAIPSIQNQYFFVKAPSPVLTSPKSVTYQQVSPTKKIVHIKDAQGPFYLTMAEAYHPKWRLELNNSKANGLFANFNPKSVPDIVSANNHLKWDGSLNAWYVDPAVICGKDISACEKGADGSYDLDMIIEFSSQRWMNVGYVFSFVAFMVVIWLIVRGFRRDKPTQRKSTARK